jgi:uncharacterized protein with ParB-like and HNH nuclease domain/predicted transport protein
MKATEAKLLEFLRKSPQFVIPIYQRTYSWTEGECRQLWEDIVRCGKDDRIAVHFIGSIVYIESGLSQVSHQAPLLVIDGQQRLTTVSLLLAALAETVGDEEAFDGFTARKIRNYFLLNSEEKGDRHYKLLLSQTDKASLTALVAQTELPHNRSLRVTDNYGFFKSWLASSKGDLPTICKGIAKLVIVDIALNRDQDNPQLIFESMNSTGKELSQADLIRNFILMGLEPDLQTRLYENYWRPMEEDFGQKAYSEAFDGFMRRYLTMKTGKVPKQDEVYDVFKQFARMIEAAREEGQSVESLVADIRKQAGYFCAMTLGKESNPRLRQAFDDLRELRVEPAYPFLLEVYDDYAAGMLNAEDFAEIVRLVESYVFRRLICAIPANSLLKTFATLARRIDRKRYLESVKAQFQLMPSYRRFPTDEEFERGIQRRDVYNFRSRSYLLRCLENHGKKERIAVENYTIEHILPQNPNLNAQWRADLGADWKKVQNAWLHTLGNLTLTGYNSEYSDKAFAEKRDAEGGFARSPLALNEGLGDVAVWNEDAIKERAQRVGRLATKVWQSQFLDDATLHSHQSKTGKQADDQPDYKALLDQPAVQDLLAGLRQVVLSVCPTMTERQRKQVVVFRKRRRIVCVIPQRQRLKLVLNLKYGEVDDPHGICQDLTGVGHWGTGDVGVVLTDSSECSKILPLVQQAYDKWNGGGNSR